ncbi:microtubule-actin cross-linking factor 1 isoform X16 [Odontesthes bonariensis]|uniref:microtubule-actin cross-linking factor 1 isoform X16 n=1 Tax=Odontesthes bonariensis TaxID=219752 RepID=UPI003F58A7F8
MESSDDDTLSERSCVSERSCMSEPTFRSERSGGSLSPCTSGLVGPPGDTLPWNLSKHERRKRKSQDSVLDPAERAVVRVADERDRVQKKTFTKWVNKHLIKVRKHITDLYEDLRDGHNLISLLEVLSGVTLQQKSGPASKRAYASRAPPLILLRGEEDEAEEEEEGAQGPREKGRMRFHRLQNVQIALDFLKQRQVKLVNIRNDDITDGNPKLTLGLIWTIILHFQISEIYVSGESGDLTAKEKLLLWSQQAIEGYPGIRCVNFTSCWSDGRMFNALLHRYRPDLIDMEAVSRQSNRDNLEQAFEIAESLGVTRLLDAEDVDVPSPDEKSVITYVSSIYDAFPKIPEGGEGVAAHEVDQRWSEYQSRFLSLLQWSRQHTAIMANKNFPQNPAELKALYNEYVHFKETEIPARETEKAHIEHLYKLLEMWIEFGRIKLPQGLHPNDLEEEWGKLILEMLDREKALRPAVERLELLLQRANKIQNMALDCEEKLTLAKNTLQADMSRAESGEAVHCERELACYLQDCESLIRQLNQELKVLRDEKYYQVEQLAFRVSCLQEELVSLRLQCSSVYRKGHFSPALGGTGTELTSQRSTDGGLSLGQTLLGAVGAVGAALLRRPMARSQLVAMSASEDEGSLRFIYELLGWVEETQELLEGAEWGADLPSVENNLQKQNSVHSAVEELMGSLQEARSYEDKVSPNFKGSYSETLAKLEHQYCKLLEHSSWRLQSLESLHAFVSHCTEELIWLNEREEEELAFDWSDNNSNMNAKREIYSEVRLELAEKQDVMQSLQETASRLCQENHPAKQTVEAYSAALQTQWQWVDQLCVCVEQHLKDNTAYFQFMSDARDCESYLRQLQETIKRQYTCDKNSRLSKLEDLLQDSMEEKEQLIEYRSTVASLVGRAKTVVQLRPRSAESPLGATTPIRAICDYRQIEITISRGEECVLEDNSQRTKWKVISPTGNEAMVPSVCFTVPPPNQEASDTAGRAEQLYQKVMSLWHQLHVNMKSVVSWHYLLKDVRAVSEWTLDSVRCQSPSERQHVLEHMDSQLSDFLEDSKESSLFTPAERRELEKDVQEAQQHCRDLLLNMETAEKDESVSRSYLSELQNITLRLNEAEKRLMRGIETPPPSRLSASGLDATTVQIAEQEKLQSELEALRSGLGDVSRRCVAFFEEKPTSSSVPVLRSELSRAVERTDKLHNLSSVYFEKLKTVDLLLRSLDDAESQVRKYENTLSEEDIVPADTTAIHNLRDQFGRWQAELSDQEGVFQALQAQMGRAKEAGSQLSRFHPDRSPELERYQEKANQMAERWSGIKRQTETRRADLEALGSALQQYRNGHSALIKWIEETTERQENTQPGQTDSKALSEQLAQQTALVVEIEQNQTKLDECQTHSKQYCASVKDYELQLMTYRAFVESMHKSPVKRRRMHSSSDAITQEFMDLRTRYTALVTLTTQHVKYISDALRRLEEEEKEVEEERQARVGQVSDLLGWVKGLQGRTGGPNAESSLAAQQAISEQLVAKKDQVAEAIRSTQVFLLSKQASKLSSEERAHVEAQLGELTATYNQLLDSSTQQLQQLEQQLAKEEERKVAQQQKVECSQKLEGLNMWLAGAASLLANQTAGAESDDVNVLQEKQKKLKEVQKDLQTKGEGIAEAIRSVEEFLAERGESLSPEEKENLQRTLTGLKEQYGGLRDSANKSLSEVNVAISTTVQQNTQRAKAVEDLQETQSQIDSLLNELTSLNQPASRGAAASQSVTDAPLSQPEGAVRSHTEMLQAELQQLQAQQAQLLQISQSTRSLLEQPDSTVPPEEKQRLRAALDQLQAQHQDRLQSCQDRLRKSEALKDELTKFLQEHGGLGSWLEQSEQELRSLGEGETDAQGLKDRLEEHRKLAEDVICHKADLRFVSISGQKVLDSVQGALEQVRGSDPALDGTKQLVGDKLHEANHRYTALHTKSTELGGRLSGLLERYQQYQDEVVSLHSWLSTQEQNQSVAKSSGDTDPQNLQNTLRQVQLLQDELAERSVQLERVKRAGRDLVSTDEAPSLKAVDILCAADGLEKRFGSLSASVCERAEQLQTAVAQSVSVQEGLRALLSWLDKLAAAPGPVEPTAQAVQDALTQNQKLRQELLSRQGSVEATRESVSRLLQSSDASTASGLQGGLDQLTQRYAAAQAGQAEREAELKGLLPKLESYERLGADLQVFTHSRLKALSPAGQPDRGLDDYRQTIEEVRSELEQEAGQLKSFCSLGTELSQSKAFSGTQSLLDHVKDVTVEFNKLEENVNERFAAVQACEQRLLRFRGLSGSLARWLQTAQDQLPSKEANLNTESLQRRVQQLTDLLNDWESQGSRIQDLNKTGSELETLIIDITAPQTKAGAPQINGSAGPSSVNGIHTCKDLTELQLAVSDANGRYDGLGRELKERLSRQQASLELRQEARRGAEELKKWLSDRENSLKLGQTASPSKPELVRAQAQENKALISELAEHTGKVEELKSALRKLIADNPDSPEADTWRQQLQEIDSRWQTANQSAAQRQTELETCADRLGSFASAANQLGPWLREKELMMSVLGPLSIDPNMLNTQKQQVQFMLREFETRRPQFDQLTQSAEGILSQTGDSAQDPKDLEEVRTELGSVSQQWEDLTSRLSRRSNHIDQAQVTSERYQALLRELSSSVSALSERLDAQASLSAQPEALKRRLQETGEIRSELERRRAELAEAGRLCQELSAIVAEPYLKEELSKRLESVSGPLKSLEERAADGLSQLQAALSSTQQFQQMFEELRSWLTKQADPRESSAVSLPCQPEAIRALLAQTDELQRGIASQRGSYELLQAEGVSLLATLPADERSALQSRLASLRQDWEELNHRVTEREGRLKNTLSKAEAYHQHKAELTPWIAECEEKDGELLPSLDSSALDEALQKARGLSLDLERRQPLLEAFNTAADQLLEQCCIGEEEVRDEKAQLNRRVDGLSERLLNRTSQLEELASRLKEFEEGRQAVERRLEAAKHQIEVQEALGPQACSAKSLERLRGQQESLRSLQPQVVYLRDLAQGLVQDAPQTPGGSTEGARKLQEQARDTEREYEDVTDKIEQCCSTLESRLQGVGEVQGHVRDVFSRLADLDDELDSLSPVGRDADSLASQADAVRGFLSRLSNLRSELEGHGSECTSMLRREGSSPDLLALRRETEALSRQAGKLSERGQARLDQIGDAAERVGDFYRLVAELQGLLGRAEEGLKAQGLVGSEVEMIKQQLQEFKAVEREQVERIQPKLQHVNAVGQGLIQSAAKHTDTQALEHDLETTNLRWNSLNKRVAERIAQLQEALLHCGKFQDALEPLLSWLSDTEELVANQKPPSAEYRVVKAQIQEQKLLQRLLDDRRPTVEMIRAEGERIAATADTQDREKIQTQLQSLSERWSELLDKASGRQRQLEELQVLALQFHEALEPLGEWLSATERRLSSAEPMGTQAAKITQQIIKHKAFQEDVSSREAEVDHLESLSQSLTPLSCEADRDWLRERVGTVRSGHSELADWSSRRAGLLEQALANAQLFGEDEVEVLNWLAEVAQRLAQVSVQSYQPQLLGEQHKHTLSLNEEILSRKKTVDQAIKNGQALLKQTTGEEVLLIQEKLDGIKSRYAEMTAGSSKALRTLEQALQLATRFASAHDDINRWLDGVEAELNNMEPDATPAYQERQKELKKVSAEKRLVLDTVNEVGNALLDLVPWRAREGLDRLVADANQRYRHADETITQRVQLVQAAIQRSQQYEEAVEAELAWVGETERKLASLGPLSLEPDVTVAQLQVQRAFNIDIIRHKDAVDQLLSTRDDILEACSDTQKDALMVKTDSLSTRYDVVSQSHTERFSALEQAQVLVARFWETYEELEPWLGETETLITQLPPPAIDTDALRLQQDQMRLLRESIAEHKPHIDKLMKIGPQMAKLSLQEGATVIQRYTDSERRYLAIKEEVKGRATALDEAVSQSAQFHDKMDPLLETLEGAVQRLRQPPPVAAEVEKIREQLAEHRSQGLELDKLLPSFSALCARGEELISRAAHDDPAAQAVRSRLLRLRSLWDEIRQRAEEREGRLNDVYDLAGKFWADVAALLSTLRDSQDIVKELEDPGVDPSLIKQQIEAAEAIKAETDGLREELEFVRTLGADLIFACGETEKPEVKKTIDEMNAAWEGLNRTWRERMERLEEAMTASVQYQDALQSMFDYLDNAVIKLCDMSTVGTDLGTVKQQIEELKQYKVEVYQQQIDMEKLCHQGELLLKKVSDQTDRDMIQEPLTELRHLWENLGDKITQRQHKLEAALLALGQFQHALSELQSWLNHTHTTLDTQRPVNSDPKAIEIELAKHHVLRNDVLSHHATVDTVNNAAGELLESSPGDEASHLRDQLDHLNQGWENLLLKTQERQKLLEAALQQAEGFHGELEEFLQWLRRTESQLSAAKPTGGLPETAREQLQQHTELQAQLTQRAEQYHRLLDQGESMLLARGGEEAGPGTTQTQQNLAMLQNKWASLNTKMDDRRAKLEEAVSLATGFQTSLQDTINWLTQTEQTLNMAQPPSLILDTVLFQIDEHKVFVNEVNTHREQVLALEKAGSQLRFASLKQDVVLIKNLLLSVQARWDKLVQRSLDRGRHLDEARKRAKQFHEAWRKLTDWLEEAENRLDSELEISNEPDKIKVQLAKHKEFQKALGSKQPVYDTTVRSGKAMRDKAQLPADQQKLDHLVGEVRDKWDTVCGKSVERQHKLEEALLFSGQFAEALQVLVDWLYRVEPQLAEDQPVHGDLDLVSNLMDAHKVFQKELGKRTSSVQALKRSARDLMDTGRDDTAWVKVQLQELSNRWDTVCALSVTKQTRLQQALKQAEEFRTAVQMLLEWLSEAEQTLRFRGVLPEEAETLQALLHTHRDFMGTVEEKRTDVNKAAGMGEGILTTCHPDSITTIKHWITIIRARFEEVLTWAKQHEQRLETALSEVLNNANLLEELLSWLQWAETTLVQRDTEPLPQDIPQLKTLITEHQMFMEEMTRKQPDVDKVTKTYKRKPAEPPSSLAERRGARKHQQQQQQAAMQVPGGNPRLNQLCARWQQVWLLALDRQRKLNDALDRLEELKEFANFDFDVWRKKYMRWMNHKKSRVMDFFRRIDKDQDGKITRQEFIDGILASKFPTSRLEMTAVADIFDRDGDGYIDYYEFVAALHPNKDAYRPTTDADKIEDEVTRQVAQCKCAKRFQVEQIGENKYRFFLGNQFGDSQQLRLVRILRSTVMVRVGGGWMALDEFLVKNDPCRVQHPGLKILRSDSSSSISSRIVTVTPGYFCCRARGRTNLELREKFILPEGASQGLAAFRSRGRRSKPGSRNASPTRSSSSASHSGASLPSAPSAPATPTASASSRSSLTHSRDYAKPWLAHSKTPTPAKCHCCPDHGHSHITPGHEGAPSGSKLKRPTFHSSRGSLTGENGGSAHTSKRTDPKRGASTASGPTSRAGSRAGSRASSRRGSDASDASELQDARSVCSDASDTPRRPGGGAKPSKIPTISKKTSSPKTPGSAKK